GGGKPLEHGPVELVAEPEQARACRHQALLELPEPGRMGEVPGAEHRDPLAPRPERQLAEVGVAAGRPRVLGVQVQIGIERHGPSFPAKAVREAWTPTAIRADAVTP